MQTFIAVVIIFGLLISFHELGHLLLAKRAGILCREYAIGFGPKIFSFKKGETVYTLRLLPIGGFVRMAGEDPEIVEIKPGQPIGLRFNQAGEVDTLIVNQTDKHHDAIILTAEACDLERELFIRAVDEEGQSHTYPINRTANYVMDGVAYQIAPIDRQFGSKPLLDRILTIFAGPFMNFLLAFIVFVLYFMFQGVPSEKPVLGELIKGEPAYSYGLKQGDEILKIGDQSVTSWDDITKIVSKNPNKSLAFMISRDGKIMKVAVKTGSREETKGHKSGYIGVYGPTDKSVVGSLKGGFTQTYYWIKQEVIGFKMLVTGQVGLNQLAGPVGIYDLTGQVVKHGFLWVMNWTAVLSINLGIVNLLPLPALDGGRLIFLFVEGLRGKPVDPKRETLVHFIGFAFLMLLMIVVTWNDIQKIFLQ
ncbi:RIP metalloprotease RseP [Pullulanibacillus sp. KACC 23026]|uniref:RIP metalloprotease RseP n=1 Tax=Pullulanibacillus sp. KACC 23026 TaxID=3028315 RepID=UPI0023B1EAAF|nr:RIP metalloprotease RseP [Pullulanibacillus sp. KACC 23026]WEG11588.1 RIP metalloprotease RseP [Pullulanibacillus sp. KACC 23026]